MKTKIFYLLAVVALVGCTPSNYLKKSETYKGIYDEKPLSILAMPPINMSTKVEAKELFYSSLSVPLAQKGYYVLPPLLSMEILKEESAYDAEMFENSSMKQVGELFGVDAVLFTVIEDWSKTTIASQVRVKIEYILKSAKTDAVLFDRKGNVTLDLSSTGSGWVSLAASLVATALTKEIVMGRTCNIYSLGDIPAGRYSPDFGKDGEQAAGPKEFTEIISQY